MTRSGATGIAWSAITHLLQDGAQSVIKIKGLQAMVSAQGGNQAFQNRMLAVETGRRLRAQSAIDADGEISDATNTALAVLTRLLIGYSNTSQLLRCIPVAVLLDAHRLVLTLRGERHAFLATKFASHKSAQCQTCA